MHRFYADFCTFSLLIFIFFYCSSAVSFLYYNNPDLKSFLLPHIQADTPPVKSFITITTGCHFFLKFLIPHRSPLQTELLFSSINAFHPSGKKVLYNTLYEETEISSFISQISLWKPTKKHKKSRPAIYFKTLILI